MKRISLPRNALQRINVGKAFAEYDILRTDPALFVTTPASLAALDEDGTKCIFVGRRGSGKTAIAMEVERKFKRTRVIIPQIFDLIELPLKFEEFLDTRQRPFKSLVKTFDRALLGELVKCWTEDKLYDYKDAPDALRRERRFIDDLDFDSRVLTLLEEMFSAYEKTEKLWLRQINQSKELLSAVHAVCENRSHRYTFLIDRLDESWEGSDSAIVSLMALMHASVQLMANSDYIRPYLFIRENIYERIRKIDNEFSRLETSVVFLDWSPAKLMEFVERRFVRPFITKPSLGGDAWSYFFEEDSAFSAQKDIFELCQHRPRDVLMLTAFALEGAINNNHSKIGKDDLRAASERYSISRLKDLGDEFAENYPNIQIILNYFYGLAQEYTLAAIEQFIQKLIVDPKIIEYCKWFFDCTTPYRFIELLYGMGFIGVRRDNVLYFRDSANDPAFTPRIDQQSTFKIHSTYHEALNLRDVILGDLSDDIALRHLGILDELPDGFSFDGYHVTLNGILEKLKACPIGVTGASEFEEIVGNIVRLCFFRSLTNVEPKVRTIDGRTVKDWIASNRASEGFWEMIRTKYGATQIIWECKNYEDLSAADFHQVHYYLNDSIGRFGILVFRGDEIKNSYVQHVSRIAREKSAMLLILKQRDLEVFVRQGLKGKPREAHISELYDCMVRQIS